MKYILNIFTDESKATTFNNSVAVLYWFKGFLVLGVTYKNSIPLGLLKKYINADKEIIGENVDVAIKVNH